MLVKQGQCSQCGKCCLPPVMLDNPCIERGEDRCKFYTDTDNAQLYGHCLIWGRGGRPIGQAKDRFGNRITQEQIDWFNHNCIDYPAIEDAETGYLPPSECSFTFEVAIDG